MSLSISKVQQFPQATLQYIPQNEYNTLSSTDLYLLGGMLSDGRHVWHAKGPCLEIRNQKTGSKVGAWTFGCILKDSSTRVVCVEEIQRAYGRLSLLAVGVECTITGGLICIFDILNSKVIRAIHIKEKISSLRIVDPGLEVLNLPGPLHDFDGIICVGTEGGNILLIDMCRQICESSKGLTVKDELSPCQLTVLNLKNINKIDHFRECSVRDGNHLAIHLNEILDSKTEHFTLKGPKGEDRLFVNKDEVVISAIYYCPQLTSLLAGFNFGAFQLWNLTNLSLVYTSPVCDDHLPITNFALQEPTDDPRAFCYIWVSYSNTELYQTGLPFAVMYSISYESKEYHEGYGYLYQDFQHCSIRYQVELGSLDGNMQGSSPKGGKCLNIQPVLKQPCSFNTTGDTLALCVISWSVWFEKGEQQTNVLIFDLNQWYKEQMPNFTKWKNCTNYILKVNISELVVHSGRKNAPLLYILLDESSLSQFVGVQRLEEYFYPAALSFDLWALRENDVCTVHNESLQRTLLYQLETVGPLSMMKPTDIYKQMISLGLIPLFVDMLAGMPTIDYQREMILNVALEYQLIGWICKCASEWANGSFSSAGCTLDFLLNWAFQRAVVLKTNCDRYCVPLFDYSQLRLDYNTTVRLKSCSRQINNLTAFYRYVLDNVTNTLSLNVVSEQYTSLEMISVYFEVLQWLVNVGLLPEGHTREYPRTDHFERISAPYPVQNLMEFYNEKRAQLRLLSKETFVKTDSLLFIDNLITNKCGADKLHEQWQDDGGSGMYPPPSLQSMLRTYLVQGASISHKHSLVIYLFLDLAMALDQTKYSFVITHLIKFPAVFKVSPSIIKITQAFWQLDHGDYTTAVEQLLDPFVLGEDLQPWHHAVTMRVLLLQEQYSLAMLYMKIRKPPVSDEKDILTTISLFIANNMLDEALSFKRHLHCAKEDELLRHFFYECNKNKSIDMLLYKCLSNNEERAFFDYLKSVNNPATRDLQVFYHLLRSRFIEAFDVHSNMRRSNPDNQGLVGQRSATITDQVVKIFKTHLPNINRDLVEYVRKERTDIWKEVPKPTPLSVFVHDTKEQIRYKSTMIHAALAKAKYTFTDNFNDTNSTGFITEETPFLRTPTVSKKRPRLTGSVIKPKVVVVDDDGEEVETSPSKRLKLSPRLSITSPTSDRITSIHSKMLTPVIRRKTSQQKDLTEQLNEVSDICTPQSILKIRNLVRQRDSINEESLADDDIDDVAICGSRRSNFGLQPRKSLCKTSRQQHVKFDDKTKLLSSVESSPNVTAIEDMILQQASLSSQEVSLMVSSKNSSAEDTFCSANTSDIDTPKPDTENLLMKNIENPVENSEGSVEERKYTMEKSELEIVSTVDSLSSSPKPRRSYKRSLSEETPSRFSPRLSKALPLSSETLDIPKTAASESREDSVVQNIPPPCVESNVTQISSFSEKVESTHTESPVIQSPRLFERVKSRKSLSRKVLEHNAFMRNRSLEKSVLKEFSFSKCEKTVFSQKIRTTKLNPDLSERFSSTSNTITKESVLENSVYTDSNSSKEVSSDFEATVSDSKLSNIVEVSKSTLDPKDVLNTVTKESSFDISHKSRQEEYLSDNHIINKSAHQSQSEKEDSFMNSAFLITDSVNTTMEELPKVERQGFEENQEDITTVKVSEISANLALHSDRYEMTKGDDFTPASLEDKPCVTSNEEKLEIISMNVYEDLSSGTDDIMETLENARRHSEEANSILELRNDQDLANSFNLPETDIAFMEDQQNEESSSTLDTNASNEAEQGFIISAEESIISISSDGADSDRENYLSISYEDNLHNKDDSNESDLSKDDQLSHTEGLYEEDDQDNSSEEEADVESVEDKLAENTNESNESDLCGNHSENPNEIRQYEPPVNVMDIYCEKETACTAVQEEETMDKEKKNLEVSQKEKNLDNLRNISQKSGEAVHENAEQLDDLTEYQEINTQTTTVNNRVELNVGECSQLTDQESSTSHLETKHDSEPNPTKNKIIDNPSIEVNIPVKPDAEKSTVIDIPETTTTSVSKYEKEKNIVFKVEQGTNTTIFGEKVKADGCVTEKEKRLNNPDKSKPKLGEDSSSDTTEGDNITQEIVVQVQVHTPRKKRIEEPLVKRVTRRNSAVISQNLESETLTLRSTKSTDNINFNLDDVFMKDLSPSPATVTPRTIRTRRSSDFGAVENSIDLNDMGQSPQVLEIAKDVKNILRQTRSASVDGVKTYSRKRSTRSSSVDEKLTESMEEQPRRRGRPNSVACLPIITEEKKITETSKGGRTNSTSALDVYASSRRLTRKQASILKSITNPSTVTAQDDSEDERAIDPDDFDPIVLLDKVPFQGKPDPDEEKVYNSSPSDSSVTSQNKPVRRRSRSNSTKQDEPSTPVRITRQRVSVDSPSTPASRIRSRRQSDSSMVSEMSEPVSPPKKSKTLDCDDSQSSVVRVTRSRAGSVSSLKSDVSSSSVTSKTRGKKIVAKTSLPEITEERPENDSDGKKPTRKRINKYRSAQ